MLKNILSIILLIVFVNFILTPTVISLVDSTTDVSSVFSLNEEEKKENDLENDVQAKIFQNFEIENLIIEFSTICNQRYEGITSKHCPELHLPPPELS